MADTSEKLIRKFELIGSNGVDFILNKNGLYIIEINPRIQGTFECVQQALGINMLEAHIKACQNEIISIDKAKYYSYKKINTKIIIVIIKQFIRSFFYNYRKYLFTEKKF